MARVKVEGQWVHRLFPVALMIAVSACQPPPEADPGDRTGELRVLQSLPYANWVYTDPSQDEPPVGITRHDEERTSPGLNLFTPRHSSRAYLMALDGSHVHQWQLEGSDPWQHVEMIADDRLLVLVKERELRCLDWTSNLLWTCRGRFHHEATQGPDGRLWAATRKQMMTVLHGIEVPVLVDYITVLSARGQVLREISLLDLFADWITPGRTREVSAWATRQGAYEAMKGPVPPSRIVLQADTPADLFHLNSIEVLDSEIPGVCRAGDLLISPRELDSIAIVSQESERIVWSWGEGELDRQHHPTMLESGNILIFDNGPDRGFSRVVELDPRSKRIVWEYRGSEDHPFFSPSRGSSQRLGNGNTLITESQRGRAFEVTSEGEIVWEFFSPELQEKDGRSLRASIYRMERVSLGHPEKR